MRWCAASIYKAPLTSSYRGLNYSDPFGLCVGPLAVVCVWIAEASFGELVAAAAGATIATVATQQLLGNSSTVALPGFKADATAVHDESWEGLSPDELKGKSPQEVDEAIPDDWTREPSARGGGTRYKHPRNKGEQIRVQPGNPNDPNPAKRGPYCRISRCGEKNRSNSSQG